MLKGNKTTLQSLTVIISYKNNNIYIIISNKKFKINEQYKIVKISVLVLVIEVLKSNFNFIISKLAPQYIMHDFRCYLCISFQNNDIIKNTDTIVCGLVG